MGTDSLFLYFNSIDEPYAAGLFQSPDKGYFLRHCQAYASWFERATLAPYCEGEQLYPDKDRFERLNTDTRAVKPGFARTYEIDWEKLKKKGCTPETEAYRELQKFAELSHSWGYMHGAANYHRIVKEGLNSYIKRIRQLPEATSEEAQFKQGLLCLTHALQGYIRRCRDYLLSVNAPKTLTDAMGQVPFEPARNYYEGLVCWNTVFYFDGCDNLGCLDVGLQHLYNGEDYTDIIAELFGNIDAMNMWSVSIGPQINEITKQAIKAADGKRRPMVELKINNSLPDEIWELSFESLKKGNSNPSFYNNTAIKNMLHERFGHITEEDLTRFCGCGCTETNLEGLTRAGGTDCDLNLLQIFEAYLYENLETKKDFAAFFDGMCKAAVRETDLLLDEIDRRYTHMAKYLPQPMRTLLYDDCIDKGKDFNAGGARYSWTMNSESGLINVIDSLAAVKELYYDKKLYSAQEFLSLLKAEDDAFFNRLKNCPCFGTDNAEVDAMGASFAQKVFDVYRNKKPKLSFLDGYTLTEHQFLRYESCGAAVGATPDGRHAKQPTCDSLAAIRGKAINGPTAMLCSCAKLPQNKVDGISVVNVTLSRNTFDNPQLLKALVMGYFKMGGIQLQFTITDTKELQDAMLHPEKHEDLIVRVGGYSEYFNNLSPALKQSVIERNIHDLAQ